MKYISICLTSGQIIHEDVDIETAETLLVLNPALSYTFRTNAGIVRLLPNTVTAIGVYDSDISDKGMLIQ